MTRLAAGLLALCLAMSGCTAVEKTAGPEVITPRQTDHGIVAGDGAVLPLRSWLPDNGDPSAVIVALHGFDFYSIDFDEPGKSLASRGIAVYAIDQRGFGAAPNRGYWAGETTMVDDAVQTLTVIGRRYPRKPLFLLGESMGGAVAILAAVRPDRPPLSGVILAAPAVWTRDSMNVLERSALWVLNQVAPGLTLSGSGLHITASDNLPLLRKLSADPLVIRLTRVDAVKGLCDLMDDAFTAARRLTVPTLVLYGKHDEVIPAEPTYQMMQSLPRKPVPPVEAIYPEGYHMLLIDLDSELVLTDVTAWMAHPDRPLPSGDQLLADAGKG